jgi:hypothetical protein
MSFVVSQNWRTLMAVGPVAPELLTTQPSVYLALCNDGLAPDAALPTGCECQSPDYGRQLLLLGNYSWVSLGNGTVAFNQTLNFGTPGYDWGVLDHWAIMSDVSVGVVLLGGPMLAIHPNVGGGAVTLNPGVLTYTVGV